MESRASVSRLAAVALGGRFGERDAAVDFRLLDAWFGGGGRLLETAHVYAGGQAERRIGAWLRARGRDGEVRVTTKIGHPLDDGTPTLKYWTLRQQAETSRERLRTEHLALVLLHRDDPRQPVSLFADVLAGLVADGIAAAVGVANWSLPRLERLRLELGAPGPGLFASSVQWSIARPRVSLYRGTVVADPRLLGWHLATDTPLIAWTANAGGWFAGRGDRGPFDTAENRRLRASLIAEAAHVGVPPASLALARTIRAGPHVCAVVGAETIAEIDDALLADQLAATL